MTAAIPAPARAMLATDPARAREAWLEWRAAADLDRLSPADFQTIPCFGNAIAEWTPGDPAQPVLTGILRRAWTGNQVFLSRLRAAAHALEDSGCGPVVAAGSPAVALLNRRQGSVRPIHDLRVAVPRDRLTRACATLESLGWSPRGDVPAGSLLDRIPAVYFSKDRIGLLLQWRLLPVTPDRAMDCEQEFLRHTQRVDCGGAALRVPGPEHALILALCGRFHFDSDPVPWEADAALLPADRIDWMRWTRLGAEFAPEAFERLESLRMAGYPAPAIARPDPPPRPKPRRRYRPFRTLPARVLGKCLREANRLIGGTR